MPRITLSPVTWVVKRYGGERALIGNIEIGSVDYTVHREDQTPWYSRTAFTNRVIGHLTIEEAKAAVEQRVLSLLAKLVTVAE